MDRAAEIKRRLNAQAYARAAGITPSAQSGERWIVRCPRPEHEDRNPSAAIYADGWKCFGCGAGGDALDLVATVEGLDCRAQFGEVLDAAERFIGGVDVAQVAPKAPQKPAEPVKRSNDALALLEAVWRILEPLPVEGGADAWLWGRGLDIPTAHAAGVRDAEALREALPRLRDHSAKAAIGAGLASVNKQGKVAPWWPLRGQEDGALIPLWDGKHPFPVGYRWRFVVPVEIKGREIKCAAMPGGMAKLPLGLDQTPDSRPVLIAEGEPDCLTLRALYGDRARVLGAVTISSGWPWLDALEGAPAVIVATHKDQGSDREDAILRDLRAAKRRVILCQPPKGEGQVGDWNDRLLACKARKLPISAGFSAIDAALARVKSNL